MNGHAKLAKKLMEIDKQIGALTAERQIVVSKLNYLNLVDAMREAGEESLKRLEEEMKQEPLDPQKACYFVNTTLSAWRHTLGSNFFPHAMSAIPEHVCVRLTKTKAMELFTAVADAIKKDLAELSKDQNK